MPRYTVSGEILSPVHIGSGQELDSYEYLIKAERFYKLNFFEYLAAAGPEEQERFLARSLSELRRFLADSPDIQQFAEYEAWVTQAAGTEYRSRVDRDESQLLLRQFIRTLERPYIPGSSLKGAIRTAVVFHLLDGYPTTRYADEAEGQALKSLNRWNRFDSFTDPFRCVKLSDAMLPPESIQIDRIHIEGMEAKEASGEPVALLAETTRCLYNTEEALAPKFTGTMLIDAALASAKGAGIRRRIDRPLIVGACNIFAKALIKEEFSEYFRFSDDPGHEFYQWLQEEQKTLGEQECLLRLGWGGGKYSVTLELKKDEPEWIQTRKLTSDDIPMGWVKLAFVEL